jgi:signal transduction histidine kinase
VEVVERDEHVSVLVSDDGQGFGPSARTAGFGLMGMRERSDLLCGQLSVDSTLGGGTTVTVALPATRRQRAPGLTATPVATEG